MNEPDGPYLIFVDKMDGDYYPTWQQMIEALRVAFDNKAIEVTIRREQ